MRGDVSERVGDGRRALLKTHKYSIGQNVRYTAGPFGRFGPAAPSKWSSFCRWKVTSSSTASRAPARRSSGSPRKASSIAIADRLPPFKYERARRRARFAFQVRSKLLAISC